MYIYIYIYIYTGRPGVPARENTNNRLRNVGPYNLKPGAVCVCGMSGLRNARTLPTPTGSGSRAGPDLPTNVEADSRAVSYVNTHRPRFHVRVRHS